MSERFKDIVSGMGQIPYLELTQAAIEDNAN